MVKGWEQLNAADGLVPYLDYTTPDFYDSLSADLQGVIDGSLSPGELSSKMQRSYSGFQEKKRSEGKQER
jgi:raffinose/stachyose/melibiose transport system substrate-binding protein